MKKEVKVERLPGRCPHCGGTYTIDDDVNKCLACSRTITSLRDRKSYYEHNKTAIMEHIKVAGRPSAQLTWKIPSGTLSRLLKSWNKNGGAPTDPAVAVKVQLVSTGLPAWSDNWPEAVMLKWLEIYQERR